MAEAAKGITPEIAPEVTEEIVAEAMEQAKEAPSRLRQTLRELERSGSAPASSFSRPLSFKGASQFYSMK